jgi:phage head maturation protease
MSVVYLKQSVDDPATNMPAIVRGYAALFGRVSTTTFERGLPEIIAPHAFDSYLATGRRPYLIFNHQSGGLLTAPESVRVWADDVGLAFEAKNIFMNDQNQRVIGLIAKNIIWGCSWRVAEGLFDKGGRSVEEVSDGRKMWVIRNVAAVRECGPCEAPAYDETGCWLASADPRRLPGHLLRLAQHWRAGLEVGAGR